MANLKNINFMSEERFESLTEFSEDDLYAVETDWLLDNKITNCLTHIPQDIKLELVDGTLTAKQGSMVWIPYGTTEAYQIGDVDAYGNTVVATSWDGSKFFYVIRLLQDYNKTDSTSGIKKFTYFRLTDGTLNAWQTNIAFSGDTYPSSTQYMFWYDTKNNVIKVSHDSGATWLDEGGCSLPLGIITTGGGTGGTLDQTFNGFGYIGSTVFALPGVKGLIPNGRNKDGTLKNIEHIIDKVLTQTFPGLLTRWIIIFSKNNGSLSCPEKYFYVSETQPAVINQTQVWYKPSTNEMFYSDWQNTSTFEKKAGFCCITLNYPTNTTISDFKPYSTFQTVDYNDLKLGTEFKTVVETYQNGSSWYRIWSDGWCEQGGSIVVSNTSQSGYAYSTATLTLLKPLANLISWNCTSKHDAFLSGFGFNSPGSSATTVTVYQKNVTESSYVNPFVIWVARGYIA